MRDSGHLVVLSGAGISAESGLKTFRGAGGLWEGVPITDVATPEAWDRDFQRVLRFYNERRQSVRGAEPNQAHRLLADLQKKLRVSIITQNIDDLHERAGSEVIVHLHGEIMKARSTANPDLVYELADKQIEPGDHCELGSQLRPHIVWFGEAVPMMEEAAALAQTATHFLVVGTSLEVYPAAGLVTCVSDSCRTYVVDPNPPRILGPRITSIALPATSGLQRFAEEVLQTL